MTGARGPVQDLALAHAVAAMPTPALVTDAEQRVVYLNPAFERLTGYGLDELEGVNCRVLQAPETDRSTVQAMRAALTRGRPFSGEVLNRRRNGELFWNALLINPVLDGAGRVVGFLSAQTDVTAHVEERRSVADRLQTAEMLLDGLRRFTSADPEEVAQALCDATVQAGAPSAVLLQERDGAPAVVAAAGRLPAPLGAAGERTLLASVAWPLAPGHAAVAHRRLGLPAADRAVVVPVVPLTTTHAALVGLWGPGSGGEKEYAVVAERMERLARLGGLALDNLELIERIRSAAEVDDLTGVASRAAVHARLEQALAAGPVAVLYLDVDRFKRMNDSLGHVGGDVLLARLAARVRTAVGDAGAVGRLGGDEFLVVLPGADEAAATAVEARIAADLREPFDVDGRTVFVRVSSGPAVGRLEPDEDATAAASRLVQQADGAMYAVKRARPHRDVETRLDLVDLEVDLRRALAQHELGTWFQPQYDGASGRIAGFEALARWRHPSRGWVPPRVFVPLAEESGVIRELGARVLQDAARFAEAVASRLGRLDISVNVAAAELRDEAYLARVADLLRGRRRDWSLTLEITELDLEEGDDAVRLALVALRRLGVGIAIDDFGSGSSSLRMLQDLPVTAVKIDESFLRRDGALREGMIAAIVALGRELGLEVMAEGVETAAQLATLRRLGCGRVQGFLLAAPAPAEAAFHAVPVFAPVDEDAVPARD